MKTEGAMEKMNIFNTEKRIRLGIWGLGRGSAFIKAARELNIDVVAGCDFNDEIRERFRKECPEAKITSDEKEFLSNPDMDAVLVATFFTAHADHAIKALEAGYHVMSEVTAFFTPADGVRLAEAVEKSGKVYNLLENYPFTKENMYLAKMWKDGLFGEFQYGEFDYLHSCRDLCYRYCVPPDFPEIEPGYTAHSWRSWLDFHYYCTHSLGPCMKIAGVRPVEITAFPEAVELPGFLPGSGMSKPCASLIRMNNGGIMRNLCGATTGDYHMAKRIWGTRAAAESLDGNLTLRLGAAGGAEKTPVQPVWPELGELAETSGHGGGDFWELYYFARQILTGEPAPWDIYSACDVTLAGIMAVRSHEQNGAPMEIPDFRDPAVREKYRNDHGAMKRPFDPAKIFPEGHDTALTSGFNRLIVSLEKTSVLLRKALDGAKVYEQISGDKARLQVIQSLHQILEQLPALFEARSAAQNLISLYPDSPAAYALKGMLTLSEPEASQGQDLLRQSVENEIKRLLK
ncbi:MAG: Gfo/Idh/MocA family oxidoreductase [Lentisphaeria bacterium]|nr:Gfo/Idh/MocA family oxidoreductase [Lentisphaeria bacterium]